MGFHENYIVDNSGHKVAVVLPVKEYKKILNELEELEDIRMYDEVKAKNEPRLSLEEYLKKRQKRKRA